MALIKGFNVINNLKGKIGNIVVQKGVYGESVVRAYTSEVKNPKTIAQSNQRMKAAPTQYARRAMKEIIDHSFEGIAYGQKSLNHFVSLAMKGNAAPAQHKGDMRFIPGKYQMSAGSLAPISSEWDGSSSFVSNLVIGENKTGSSSPTTIALLSQYLLAENTQLMQGDNITVCWVTEQEINGKSFYTFHFNRMTLDPTNTAGVPLGFLAGNKELRLGEVNAVAACAILSRQSGANWMRSSATMAVSADIEDQYFSPTAIESAIASYTAVAKATFSDWYMNQGEVNILRFGTAKVNDLLIGYEDTDNGNLFIPTAILIEDGQQKVACFETEDGIVGLDGKKITYADGQGGEGVIDPRSLKAGYVVLEWSDDYLGKF